MVIQPLRTVRFVIPKGVHTHAEKDKEKGRTNIGRKDDYRHMKRKKKMDEGKNKISREKDRCL